VGSATADLGWPLPRSVIGRLEPTLSGQSTGSAWEAATGHRADARNGSSAWTSTTCSAWPPTTETRGGCGQAASNPARCPEGLRPGACWTERGDPRPRRGASSLSTTTDALQHEWMQVHRW